MDKNYIKTRKLHSVITDWVYTFKPTHLLTVRLPIPATNAEQASAHKILYRTMKQFEKNAIKSHWNKKTLHFIGMAERGKTKSWHWHLLLIAPNHHTNKLKAAANKTIKNMKLSEETIHITPIKNNPQYVIGYCLKELDADKNTRFDSDRLIFSWDLFDLKYKSHKPHKPKVLNKQNH